MSYFTSVGGVDDVITKIGSAASTVAGAVATYGQLKSAARGEAVVYPQPEPFNWTPVIILGGVGILALVLFTRK